MLRVVGLAIKALPKFVRLSNLNSGTVEMLVIGTPKFQVATALVGELTITLSAYTPFNIALAL